MESPRNSKIRTILLDQHLLSVQEIPQCQRDIVQVAGRINRSQRILPPFNYNYEVSQQEKEMMDQILNFR
jgi:hypothetical protein